MIILPYPKPSKKTDSISPRSFIGRECKQRQKQHNPASEALCYRVHEVIKLIIVSRTMTVALMFLPKRTPDKLSKQRMGFIRSRLELRVELHTDVKTIVRNLDSLDKRAVR